MEDQKWIARYDNDWPGSGKWPLTWKRKPAEPDGIQRWRAPSPCTSDAAFIVDWLRGQAEYHFNAAPPAGADTWEPTAEPPLGNVTEPLSGTLDADLPVARE